jgi:hypothetical protein
MFSTEWCAEAMRVANETSAFLDGLVDPASFTLMVGFACTDVPDLASWAEFDRGAVTAWNPGVLEAGPGKATMAAPLEIWRSAAEGEESATGLLLGGKIKLRDTRNRVTYNYAAFDELLACWAHVPTDWDR